jgi:hypothetical protein
MDTFPAVRASRVCSCALWIISEYCCRSAEEIAAAVEMIKSCLGPLPLFKERGEEEGEEAEAPSLPIPIQVAAARPAVLADGSYATQTALPGEAAPLPGTAANATNVPNLRCAWGVRAGTQAGRQGDRPQPSPSHCLSRRWRAPLPRRRALLLGGDYFLGAVAAASLAKLVLRMRALRALPPASLNRMAADVMACITAMLRLGESGAAAAAGVHPLDADSRDRMAACLRTLAAGADDGLARVWLDDCRASFTQLIADKQQREAAEAKQEVRRPAPGSRGDGLGGGAVDASGRGPAPVRSMACGRETSVPDEPQSPPPPPALQAEGAQRGAAGRADRLPPPEDAQGAEQGGAGGQRGLRPGPRHGAGRRGGRRLQPPQQDCAAHRLQRPHLRGGIRHGWAGGGGVAAGAP